MGIGGKIEAGYQKRGRGWRGIEGLVGIGGKRSADCQKSDHKFGSRKEFFDDRF